MTRTAELVARLRMHPGVRSKLAIQGIEKAFGGNAHCAWLPSQAEVKNGDDAAAIPDGDGYLLFAAEGIVPELVRRDPWFAGFCSILVNVNDIAAMGGVPYAVTDVLFASPNVDNQRLMQGMRDASLAFGVPVVGGHTGKAVDETWLSVSIVGRARHLLSGFAARPGHALVCAIDLRGAYRGNYDHFNAATSATSQQLRRNVGLLSACADLGLAVAAKDISQAGLAGTLVMLCESSGVGAELDVEKIPKPPGVDTVRWLTTFPSFGFLLACDPGHAARLVSHFEEAGVAAAEVGQFDESRHVVLKYDGESGRYWDLNAEPLTGLGPRVVPSADLDVPRAGYAAARADQGQRANVRRVS